MEWPPFSNIAARLKTVFLSGLTIEVEGFEALPGDNIFVIIFGCRHFFIAFKVIGKKIDPIKIKIIATNIKLISFRMV